MRKQELSIFLLLAVIVTCANLSVRDSLAQSYPVKPIRMLVGFSPGGASDVTARMVAQRLLENLGEQVVVDNRPGASGAIATAVVANSPADGYTLLMMAAGDTVLPALRSNLPYDLERDLAPVSLVAIVTYVLVVHPSVPARHVKELIALARSQRDKLNYASAGVGSQAHLAAALFNLMAKVNIVHVPYKGAADIVVAVTAGQVDIGFPSIAPAQPLVKAGKLRALGVTIAKRASLMPSIPTLNESGLPGYDHSGWFGVVAPARTPKNIIARLNVVIGKVINTPEMTKSLSEQGLEPATSAPEQFALFIQGELAKNAKLIKLIGVKAQ